MSEAINLLKTIFEIAAGDIVGSTLIGALMFVALGSGYFVVNWHKQQRKAGLGGLGRVHLEIGVVIGAGMFSAIALGFYFFGKQPVAISGTQGGVRGEAATQPPSQAPKPHYANLSVGTDNRGGIVLSLNPQVTADRLRIRLDLWDMSMGQAAAVRARYKISNDTIANVVNGDYRTVPLTAVHDGKLVWNIPGQQRPVDESVARAVVIGPDNDEQYSYVWIVKEDVGFRFFYKSQLEWVLGVMSQQ